MSDDLAREFKLALRGIAATVSVITARFNHQFDGMTATAVTSVCAEPPSLLACVNRTAGLTSILHETDDFCVNFLCSDQIHISRVFSDSGRRHERFQVGNWVVDQAGPPYLADAQANIFCRLESAIPVQTHTVFVGRVYAVRHSLNISPLLYLNGTYSSLKPTSNKGAGNISAPR